MCFWRSVFRNHGNYNGVFLKLAYALYKSITFAHPNHHFQNELRNAFLNFKSLIFRVPEFWFGLWRFWVWFGFVLGLLWVCWVWFGLALGLVGFGLGLPWLGQPASHSFLWKFKPTLSHLNRSLFRITFAIYCSWAAVALFGVWFGLVFGLVWFGLSWLWAGLAQTKRQPARQPVWPCLDKLIKNVLMAF